MGECVLLATQSGAAFRAVAAHSAGLHTAVATARPVGSLGHSHPSPNDAKVEYEFFGLCIESVQHFLQAQRLSSTWTQN